MCYLIVKDQNGREARVSVEGSYRDDLYITTGDYSDDNTPVNEETLDWIQKHYPCQMYEAWLEDFWDRTYQEVKDGGKYS